MRQQPVRPVPEPRRIGSYFRMEWPLLAAVTASGLLYNAGLLAGPWFEGQLAQCLADILGGSKTFADMLRLALSYVATIAAVQTARYGKRLYVRKFANRINRSMKRVLYGNLIAKSKPELEKENAGSVLTKAIADVDACAEGMRKCTTEVFDTGVALLGYVGLLCWYDWRLALLCLIFPPLSYLIAQRMKTVVQRSGAAYKESAGRLSEATLDRVEQAATYRAFGCEARRDRDYEACLGDYEEKAVRANLWVSAMPPLYQIISMTGVLFLLYFGGKNVSGTGWAVWDIAAFSTFLSCFLKLCVKSAKAAKLFNAVQKAQVSWRRIKPLMAPVEEEEALPPCRLRSLEVQGLGFAYPGQAPLFDGLSFSALPGQIIGVTGPVACGKSALGKAFLCETPYTGSIRINGGELSHLPAAEQKALIGYLGHDPELMSDTLRANVLMGDEADLDAALHAVCLDGEVAGMPEGPETRVGSGGVRLSGGQQQRLALARTLAHPRPVLILDDPFSALDRATERECFQHLRALAKDSAVLLLSHRLYLFPELDQVVWMENGRAVASTHRELAALCPEYAALWQLQQEGGEADA